MLNAILANLIAGLGLFFSGLRLVDANLRQAAGRQLRTVIGRLTGHRVLASLVGVMTGALVQSSSGIAFILVSLVTSGLTTVERALPIITWANVGCSALVFVAVLDLRLAILYVIGVAGAAFAFDKSHRSGALGAAFGIGMLFYGIELMKAAAEPLQQTTWFPDLLSGNRQSYLLAFVSGTGFSFVTQSSTAVSIVAIGFAETGILGPYPTMMALYGANLGSTLSRMVLSSGLRGSVRQLTAYQDLFKISGTVLFVVLLYAEAIEGVPLVRTLAAALSTRIDRQMAVVFLLFNLATAVLFTVLQGPILRLLQAWFPPDEREDEARPQYIYDEAMGEPATALDLLAKEQLRLTRRLRTYPEAMRAGVESPAWQQALHTHDPFAAVAATVEQFQREILNRTLGSDETRRLTMLQSRLSLLVYLEDSLRALTLATERVVAESKLGVRVSTFVEALDFVLLTLIDAQESGEADQIDTLATITEDRGEFVDRIRRDYLASEEGSVPADRAVLLEVTSLFERIVWITHRLSRQLDVASAEHASTSVPH